MSETLLVILVIVVLLLILSFLLYYIIKRVNLLSKNIFLNKMEEFDYLIENKEQKVTELNSTISEKEEYISNLEEKIFEFGDEPNKKEKNNNDVILPKYVDFESSDTLSSYKLIKDNFRFDAKVMIERFVNATQNDLNPNYDTYIKVRSYFTYDVLYKLSTYQVNEQFMIITELLDSDEKTILNKYLTKKNFSIKKFINNLDELISKSNPEIKIFVGNKNENYNSISSNINTIYDENIVEGFKILYKGIIYDYSI